ncbi:hypothetical protein [Catelliglobosispora koreensis]|uniref:hypothetical protein n=1 Tax=Catelliglobosispora koreensis TaxID=129052 RepID=UPI00039B0C13|nr:hypothetical protein [Catelliglobosispora koreensis]
MLGRILWNKWGMLLLGIAALAFGLVMMNSTEVRCGTDVMSPGDTCEAIDKKTNKVVGTNTYEQEKASQSQTAKVLTIVGGVLTAGGATWIVIAKLRRKPEEVQAAAPAAAA